MKSLGLLLTPPGPTLSLHSQGTTSGLGRAASQLPGPSCLHLHGPVAASHQVRWQRLPVPIRAALCAWARPGLPVARLLQIGLQHWCHQRWAPHAPHQQHGQRRGEARLSLRDAACAAGVLQATLPLPRQLTALLADRPVWCAALQPLRLPPSLPQAPQQLPC